MGNWMTQDTVEACNHTRNIYSVIAQPILASRQSIYQCNHVCKESAEWLLSLAIFHVDILYVYAMMIKYLNNQIRWKEQRLLEKCDNKSTS